MGGDISLSISLFLPGSKGKGLSIWDKYLDVVEKLKWGRGGGYEHYSMMMMNAKELGRIFYFILLQKKNMYVDVDPHPTERDGRPLARERGKFGGKYWQRGGEGDEFDVCT